MAAEQATTRSLERTERAGRPFTKRVFQAAGQNVGGTVGAIIFILVVIMALFAGPIAPHSPTALDPVDRLIPPDSQHLFGTDNLGRDIFSRTVYGARTSLKVGLGVMALATVGGIIFGLLAGYYDRLDSPLMRLMDAVMAFPGIILAIGIVAATGQNLRNVILALGVVYIPRVARLVRSVVIGLRRAQYIEAAQSIGARDVRILSLHIMPNSWAPIIVQATFVFAYGVLGEATLSFLGVGLPPEFPSWGVILGEARNFIRVAWWMMFLPGIVLTLAVLSLNLVGDTVRDLLDPRLRRGA